MTASNKSLQGSLVALVTPMKSSGAVDWAALDGLVDWHLESGTHGIVPVGTTGESATLNHDEHKQVIKAVIRRVDGRVPVVAGAGANATAEAIELTESAKGDGADYCLSVTPYYNKPTQEGLYRHYCAIAEAVDLPMVLYNVPPRTACDMQAETVARLAQVDSIVGIKEACGDPDRVAEIKALVPDDFILLSGEDAQTLTMVGHGAVGAISVTANVLPAMMAAFCEAFLARRSRQGRRTRRQTSAHPRHPVRRNESDTVEMGPERDGPDRRRHPSTFGGTDRTGAGRSAETTRGIDGFGAVAGPRRRTRHPMGEKALSRRRWRASCTAAVLIGGMLASTGCRVFRDDAGFFVDPRDDYIEAAVGEPLVVPEGMEASVGDTWPIPDILEQPTAKTYANEVPRPRLLAGASADEIKIQKLGAKSWIVLADSPDQIWPLVKQLMEDSRVGVAREDPPAGIVETEWFSVDPSASDVLQAAVGTGLSQQEEPAEGSWLDRVQVRIERGIRVGSSEVHVVHYRTRSESDGAIDTSAVPEVEGELITPDCRLLGTGRGFVVGLHGRPRNRIRAQGPHRGRRNRRTDPGAPHWFRSGLGHRGRCLGACGDGGDRG